MIAKAAQPMITYVFKKLTEERSNNFKLLRAVSLFDPIFASRNLGNDKSYDKIIQILEILQLYDALNNNVFADKI